ncbi:hypothetical protein Tsubulata_019354 [Turnera subulata]|uniref:DYW domain-containing protein n=1 Tax=Turnera subulata TaxID=218843 RepID=A0A9Q0JQN2_9ROSI|nr:hypothetical protein Tsubulata_019354 [Turnera subulata]
MISGLAMHGCSREALRMFNEMKRAGFPPDCATFNAVLLACCHGGLVDDGWRIFESIRNEYGMEPKLGHYGCMVDLLGRAGLLHKAFEFVERMPCRPNAVTWRTLLRACVNHNDLELAEKIKAKINGLDPSLDGDYVLLSNAYAGVGKFDKEAEMRSFMQEKRTTKNPGYSLLVVDHEIHEFVSGDKSHPQLEEITKFLIHIIDGLKVEGYAPDMSNVFHDIEEEEEKEQSLSYHSEKLAVAFAS